MKQSIRLRTVAKEETAVLRRRAIQETQSVIDNPTNSMILDSYDEVMVHSTWDAANVAPIRYALEDAFNNFEVATSTEAVVLAIHDATWRVVNEAVREFMKEVG